MPGNRVILLFTIQWLLGVGCGVISPPEPVATPPTVTRPVDPTTPSAVRTESPQARQPNTICSDVPQLSPGTAMAFSCTEDTFHLPHEGVFRMNCEDAARGPDAIHCLTLARQTRVRFIQTCNGECALFLIGDCSDGAIRHAECNDDWEKNDAGQHTVSMTRLLSAGTHCVVSESIVSDAGIPKNNGATSGTLEVRTETLKGSGVLGDHCDDAPAISLNSEIMMDTFHATDAFRLYDATFPEQVVDTAHSPDVVRRLEITEKSWLYLKFISKADYNGWIWLTRTCGQTENPIEKRFVYNEGNRIKMAVDPGTYYLHLDGNGPDEIGEVWLKTETTPVEHFKQACKQAPMLQLGKPVEGQTSGKDWFHTGQFDDYAHDDTFFRLVMKKSGKLKFSLKGEVTLVLSIRDACAWQKMPTQEEENRAMSFSPNRPDDAFEISLDPGTYFVVINSWSTPQTPFTLTAQSAK